MGKKNAKVQEHTTQKKYFGSKIGVGPPLSQDPSGKHLLPTTPGRGKTNYLCPQRSVPDKIFFYFPRFKARLHLYYHFVGREFKSPLAVVRGTTASVAGFKKSSELKEITNHSQARILEEQASPAQITSDTVGMSEADSRKFFSGFFD